MYTRLNGVVVTVSSFNSNTSSTVSSIVYHGQNDIQLVLNGIGNEIYLYEDEDLTRLAAIYNQVEVQRATVDLVATNVTVTISASRLSELETEQMKQDIVNQQNAMNDSDGALVELAELIEDNTTAIAELATMIDELREEIDALKPVPETETEIVEEA